MCVAVLIALGLAAYDVRGVVRDLPRRFKGATRDKDIRDFMTELLAGEGQCAVSSNDLSWVKGEARDALFEKARAKSLALVMPVQNELSEELVRAGAKAHYYGDENFKFRSRFTLVNPSRADAWLAVGVGTPKAHIIRIIDSNAEPAFNMAVDLVELAERVAAK